MDLASERVSFQFANTGIWFQEGLCRWNIVCVAKASRREDELTGTRITGKFVPLFPMFPCFGSSLPLLTTFSVPVSVLPTEGRGNQNTGNTRNKKHW